MRRDPGFIGKAGETLGGRRQAAEDVEIQGGEQGLGAHESVCQSGDFLYVLESRHHCPLDRLAAEQAVGERPPLMGCHCGGSDALHTSTHLSLI